MRLTKHEKEIVSRINKGEIWDIPSYLRSFGLGHDQTYDMDSIRRKFIEDESGRKYKVLKDINSMFFSSHSTQTVMGQSMHMPLLILRPESDIADDEWSLCEAKLDDTIHPSRFTYDDQEFQIDFKKGALVADDFKDILIFIHLWSYLRRENLVFEVSKPVSQDEISMLYELVPCNKGKRSGRIKIKRDNRSSEDENVEILSSVREIHQTVPIRHVEEFMDMEWKMNEDHLMMCREFLGKKMYPTEASNNFESYKYQTLDEAHRNLNSFVAVVALFVSVLSISLGLLHKETNYQPALENMTQQISEMQITLDDISANRLSVEEMDQIYEKLDSIEVRLINVEDDKVYSVMEELVTDIEEIRKILAEQYLPTD